MSVSTKKPIALMAVLALLTLAARAAGAFKDIALARAIGTGDALDVFLVATLPYLFVMNAVAASLGDAFLPVFVRCRDAGSTADARALIARTSYVGIVVCSLIALALGASDAMFVLVAPGFTPEKRGLALHCFRIIAPLLALGGWSAPWSAILNSSGRQRVLVLLPGLTPIVTLIVLGARGSTISSIDLALAMLAGGALEVTCMALAVVRTGWSARPSSSRATHERLVLAQVLPLVGASFLATSTSVVDQAVASTAGPGAVSALSYGGKVVALAMAVGSTALSAILFPEFARLLASEDVVGARRLFHRQTWIIFAAAIPFTVAGIALSPLVTRILFERGSFTTADTALVSRVQAMYLLQLPFHLAGMVSVRMLIALRRNQVLLVLGLGNALINGIADVVLLRWLGLPGIGLSTSIVFVASFVLLYAFAHRELKHREATPC